MYTGAMTFAESIMSKSQFRLKT
uniref:Uncharacterized protein n=1 Tax=Anguilla anguilla TaxID=7936 RepID=A0A0E9V1B4_ANGAN